MAVICHKISVKCRWNHSETFTAKIYKLGPKCRWNILIVGDNTAAKIIRVHIHVTVYNCIVTCILLFFVCLVLFFYYFVLYISIWSFDTRFFSGMAYILFIGYMSMHLVLRTGILSNPNISIGLHRCYFFLSHELIITWYYRLYFIYVRVCLFLCSAHIELGH